MLKRLYSAFPQVPVTTTQNFAPDDPFASPGGDAVDSEKEEEDEETTDPNQSVLLSMSVLEKIGPSAPIRAETVSSNKSSEQDARGEYKRSQPSIYLKKILSNEQGGEVEAQLKDAGLTLEQLVDKEAVKSEPQRDLIRKSQLLERLSLKIRDVRNCKLEVPEYSSECASKSRVHGVLRPYLPLLHW